MQLMQTHIDSTKFRAVSESKTRLNNDPFQPNLLRRTFSDSDFSIKCRQEAQKTMTQAARIKSDNQIIRMYKEELEYVELAKGAEKVCLLATTKNNTTQIDPIDLISKISKKKKRMVL